MVSIRVESSVFAEGSCFLSKNREPSRFRRSGDSLQQPVVDGATLRLTCDERRDETSTPAAGDFVVDVGRVYRDVVASVAVRGFTVTLRLASPVAPPRAVWVSYTKGAHPIRSRDGAEARKLIDQRVRKVTPWTREALVTGARSRGR